VPTGQLTLPSHQLDLQTFLHPLGVPKFGLLVTIEKLYLVKKMSCFLCPQKRIIGELHRQAFWSDVDNSPNLFGPRAELSVNAMGRLFNE
jgi:hypothetical protein